MGLFSTPSVLAEIAAFMAGTEVGDRADRAWEEAEAAIEMLPVADDDVATHVYGGANFHQAMRRLGQPDHRLMFSQWLAEARAESSFPGGMVLPQAEAKALISVLVVVTPDDLVFFDEGGERDGEMPELGRFPRRSVKSADVLGEGNEPVPEPWGESIDEEDRLCHVVVGWQPEGEEIDQDEFLFRSASVAWDAARRFRRAAIPPFDPS